jgi:hypothetical protein
VWELRVFLGQDAVTEKMQYRSSTFRGRKADAETELARLVTISGGIVRSPMASDPDVIAWPGPGRPAAWWRSFRAVNYRWLC